MRRKKFFGINRPPAGRRAYQDSESESFWHMPNKDKIAFIVVSIVAFVITSFPMIWAIIELVRNSSNGIWIIILITSLLFFVLTIVVVILFTSARTKKRKRQRQIREAGLDQIDDEGITAEEYEERFAQRQTRKQETRRRRPVIEILNERPSNETLLKKMIFKGSVKDETCAICKLDVRKRQKIVQCPLCKNLFHHDHMNDWLKNNKDCPVCKNSLVDIAELK